MNYNTFFDERFEYYELYQKSGWTPWQHKVFNTLAVIENKNQINFRYNKRTYYGGKTDHDDDASKNIFQGYSWRNSCT